MRFATVDDRFQVCSKTRFLKKNYHKHIRITICIRDVNPARNCLRQICINKLVVQYCLKYDTPFEAICNYQNK